MLYLPDTHFLECSKDFQLLLMLIHPEWVGRDLPEAVLNVLYSLFLWFFFFIRVVPVPDLVTKCALTFSEGRSTRWDATWIPP